MNFIIFLIISSGALAWNPTLPAVMLVRQYELTKWPISPDKRLTDYECRVALPNHSCSRIGQEIWFKDEGGGLFGPWLVVDCQASHHTPMGLRGLAADVDCMEMVHRQGDIVKKETRY